MLMKVSIYMNENRLFFLEKDVCFIIYYKSRYYVFWNKFEKVYLKQKYSRYLVY